MHAGVCEAGVGCEKVNYAKPSAPASSHRTCVTPPLVWHSMCRRAHSLADCTFSFFHPSAHQPAARLVPLRYFQNISYIQAIMDLQSGKRAIAEFPTKQLKTVLKNDSL
ncbi:unnamed protein product [Pleuronectes platessa]|uniref:Uncharacterized protein n=1 Tax=Pleuronectes platessa TaxID=8262 RepID=A0A9N7USX4_PLEPL|nr:unnamed protein product [Pleuronectes platessa]